jgi:hypothetical protein
MLTRGTHTQQRPTQDKTHRHAKIESTWCHHLLIILSPNTQKICLSPSLLEVIHHFLSWAALYDAARRVQRRVAYAVYNTGWRTPCTTRGGVRRVQHGVAYTVYNTGRRTPCTTRGGVHRVQHGRRTPCTTRGGVRRVQHGEAYAVYNTGRHCTTCSIVQRAALYNVQHCTTCSIVQRAASAHDNARVEGRRAARRRAQHLVGATPRTALGVIWGSSRVWRARPVCSASI